MLRFGFALLSLLVGLTACRPDEPGLEENPLVIELRRTIPAADALITDNPPLVLQWEFNRAVVPSDFVFTFAPPPAAQEAARTSPTGLFLLLPGYVPDPLRAAHWILVDGPQLDRPYVLKYLTERRVNHVGDFAGSVVTRGDSAPSGQFSILLLYDTSVVGLVTSAEQFFSMQPAAIGIATIEGVDGDWNGWIRGLPAGQQYAMAAILDTDGDGVYDHRKDWWGVARDPAAEAWAPLLRNAVPFPASEGFDIIVEAPVSK